MKGFFGLINGENEAALESRLIGPAVNNWQASGIERATASSADWEFGVIRVPGANSHERLPLIRPLTRSRSLSCYRVAFSFFLPGSRSMLSMYMHVLASNSRNVWPTWRFEGIIGMFTVNNRHEKDSIYIRAGNERFCATWLISDSGSLYPGSIVHSAPYFSSPVRRRYVEDVLRPTIPSSQTYRRWK